MDPRHPEQAISRMKELMEQYDRIEKDIRETTVSTNLGGLEREGSLVIQEICLVAPRLHEAMMQTSRQRRNDLARDAAFGYTPEEKVGKYTKATIGIEEKPVEKSVEAAIAAKEYLENSLMDGELKLNMTDAEKKELKEKIEEEVPEIKETISAKNKATKKKTTKKAKK